MSTRLTREQELKRLLIAYKELPHNSFECAKVLADILAHDAALREALEKVTGERDAYKRKYDLVSNDADYRQCCQLRDQAEVALTEVKASYADARARIANLEQAQAENERLKEIIKPIFDELKVSTDKLEWALDYLGPTGTNAEAYVKAATEAVIRCKQAQAALDTREEL